RVISLILSDVIGNPPEAIASGPTAADPSTFSDACHIIEKYELQKILPLAITNYLQAGLAGKIPETLKPGDPVFAQVENIIMGSNPDALNAARNAASQAGFHTVILSSRMKGEARVAGKEFALAVQRVLNREEPITPPACLIMGGETTVTVTGSGKGGRSQELILAALVTMKDESRPFLIAAAGTDGSDGPTDAAGAWIDQQTWQVAARLSLNPLEFLSRNDSYTILDELGRLIRTGPTGTNVADLVFALIP
ncbi:MAG: MOFRL family protein, partial [Calditrichia bacterium]